ncbi:ABC transporter ATP-binding protein [Myxococcota bacterium]|nr:ABC transporter ATP-binding protein [Myxococcota bacterium]
MEKILLELRSISHSFGGSTVLEDLTLSVQTGELVSILGSSGSGKSTLLRSVAGFVTPTSGSIWLAGQNVVSDGEERISPEERRVGMLFQDFALFPHMTVFENIEFGIRGQSGAERRVDELLELIGLPQYGTRMPPSLSGGQQQRVALARALAPRPTILLLDEPFANLDSSLRADMGRELVKILKREELGSLLVTHDCDEALGLSDRIAILDTADGGPSRFLQVGTPEMVYRNPASAEVAALTGRVSFLDDGSGSLRVIRPEEAEFSVSRSGVGRVLDRRYRGGVWELMIQLPEGKVLVDQPERSRDAPEIGSMGNLHLFTDRRVPVPQSVRECRNESH